MSGAELNSISVVGRDLLLAEVGGGRETHLVSSEESPSARAAVPEGRSDSLDLSEDQSGADALRARRWSPSTLCGRDWFAMAPGEGAPLHLWEEESLAPTCRSCLRVMDGWFPRADTPSGVGLLAWVVADTVEATASAYIHGVPAEHVESVRRAVRKQLRERGFGSQTRVVNEVVFVSSDDAYDAIDPESKSRWTADVLDRAYRGEAPDIAKTDSELGVVHWGTWVVDG